jgi:DNA-binding MarR family transcriptional regulator
VEDRIDRIVEQWRAERPELETGPLALVGRLFLAVELAGPRLSAGLAGHGLEPGWFDLLAALRRAGAPYELSPTELMRTVMLSSGGMTKRLDRVEAAGLVERRPDPDDRRGTLVRLTAKGRRIVERAVETHVAREAEVLAPLSAAERRTLDRLLRKLLRGLGEAQSSAE